MILHQKLLGLNFEENFDLIKIMIQLISVNDVDIKNEQIDLTVALLMVSF